MVPLEVPLPKEPPAIGVAPAAAEVRRVVGPAGVPGAAVAIALTSGAEVAGAPAEGAGVG